MQSRPATWNMSRKINRVVVLGPRGQIRRGNSRAQGLRRWGIDGACDLFCDVEDRFDTAFDETAPVPGRIFGTQPDTRENLEGTIGVRDGRRLVFTLPEDSRGWEGDD
jgi:hypothetical protein